MNEGESPGLKRSIGVFGAASVGIANIIGAGIFVISGIAAGLAGPSVILSFLIAGLISLLTALSTAELSSFITKTGAAYAFSERAYGRLPGFTVGWFMYFGRIVSASAVSIGFAGYVIKILGLNGDLPIVTFALSLPLVFVILNIIGVKESTMATSIMVIIKVAALILLIAFGGVYLFSNFHPENFTPFFPNGVNGALDGAAVIFFAFMGFNTVAMMSEETKNPTETIPRALILALSLIHI